MADLSMVDLVGLIERVAPVRFGKAVGTGSKRTQKSGCPFCSQGTDRFAVFIGETPQRYYCGVHGNGCGARGDAISFLREYSGLSYHDACAELGIDPGSYAQARRVITCEQDEQPPCQTWQTKAIALCREAYEFLWSGSETANKALGYLRKRGLSDETIKGARLGYLAIERYEPRDAWGLPKEDKANLYIPRGWAIPWVIGRDMWRVDIRRHPVDLKADKDARKYHQIAGSRNALYRADSIKPGYPLVIVESPLDALSGAQASQQAVWVATGSTVGSRSARWADAMAVASPILVAFDQDENGAGSQAFKYWKSTLQTSRCMPWGHDINDMLVAGMDIDAWLSDGIETALLLSLTTSEPAPTIIAHNERQLSDNIGLQSQTSAGDGVPRCYACQVVLENREGAFYADEDRDSETWGELFCVRCWHAQSEPTIEPTTLERFEAFSSAVLSITEELPPVTQLTMVPAGMTTSAYIDAWYAERSAPKPAPANETAQERFWRELHERLGGKAWDDYIAKQNAIQRERIAAIATLPFTPQPERPTPSAVATLPPPEEDVSDAALLQRYQKALGTRKKGPVFLSKPLVATNGFYSRQAALDAVQSALQCGDGLRREAALDEMHFREHGEYRKIR